jgi:hypothetical protein
MIISSDCSLYPTKKPLKTVEEPQNVLYKVYLRKTKTKKQIMPLFAANCQTSACLFHEKNYTSFISIKIELFRPASRAGTA